MDWDEEDELLYGGGSTSTAPAASTSGTNNVNNASPMPATVNPPLSLTENGTASLVKAEAHDEEEADMEQSDQENEGEGSDDGEEDMDDAESDDSLEIVMDINPSAPRPAHEMARRVGAVPVRPPPPDQIQQLQRQPSASINNLNASQPHDNTSPSKPPANPFLSFPVSAPITRPTGPPIATRSRTPPPDLSSRDAQYTPAPPAGENGEAPMDFKPVPQPIVDTDLDSIEDKRWRRPGVHMADYFNYGFDEATWMEWCSKQKRMRDERDKERENPFHVFASKPLLEAWQNLPMEQKGALMQVIMTSFGAGGPAGGMHPAMQGMMGGPMGMPGAMGMQGMGGMMGRNPMSMMQQNMNMMQQQQQGGMGTSGSNTPNPGMMGHMGMGGGMQQQQQQQQRGMPTIGGPSSSRPGFPNPGGSSDVASHAASADDDEEEYKHFGNPIAGPPARGRINPLLQRSNVSSDSETGQNAVFKKRNVSGQHQKRATSPLPDNLPKGPKSMASW